MRGQLPSCQLGVVGALNTWFIASQARLTNAFASRRRTLVKRIG